MLPSELLSQNQELLWILTVFMDLGCTVLAYRLYGRLGLYGVIVFSLLLANIMGPKLTVIADQNGRYSLLQHFFATDLLSEKFGRREAHRAVLLEYLGSEKKNRIFGRRIFGVGVKIQFANSFYTDPKY